MRPPIRTSLVLLLFLGLCTLANAADLDLARYRGKVVYLDFWASWCVPCRKSFPWMESMLRLHASQGLVVLAVNVDQDQQLAAGFLNEVGANFPIIYDPKGDIATTYHVMGMPTAVLIDRDGHVRFQHTGFFPKKQDDYEDHVRTLLHETAH